MRTKDIVVGGHYAWVRWPRSSHVGRPSRVLVLETGVERLIGRYSYSKTKRHDGVKVRFLRDNGRRIAEGTDSTVVPAEQILHTWDVHLEETRQREIADAKNEREEIQHETLLAYAKGRLAMLGIREGFEDEDYREDWNRGGANHLSFHPKAVVALLDKVGPAPPLTVTKRKDKLYVNGLVIAEDNGDGHFDHVYAALREVTGGGS